MDMNVETAQALSRLIDVITELTPWAGAAVVTAVFFRVIDDKPSDLIKALGELIRGRSKRE